MAPLASHPPMGTPPYGETHTNCNNTNNTNNINIAIANNNNTNDNNGCSDNNIVNIGYNNSMWQYFMALTSRWIHATGSCAVMGDIFFIQGCQVFVEPLWPKNYSSSPPTTKLSLSHILHWRDCCPHATVQCSPCCSLHMQSAAQTILDQHTFCHAQHDSALPGYSTQSCHGSICPFVA